MTEITISIIIPVYNGASLLQRCLTSVLKQQGDFELEIILVDDGSTDHSINLAKTCAPDILIIRQKNKGPAAARNKGIEIASGKYLAFLDADDYWESAFLKETVLFLETFNAVAVSVGQIHKIIGEDDRTMPQLLNNIGLHSNNAWLLDDFYEFWAQNNHVCTGSVLMLTDIVKETGGQRPELRITEDLEFWAYLATYGKWGFIPKVLFVSDGGEVTKEQGWVAKNKKRWASAPDIEQWEKRIIKRLPDELRESYNLAKGNIAKNLAYAMIMSDRIEMARQTTLKNSSIYPKDKIAILMTKCAHSSVIWFIFAQLLFLKERYRRI